MSETKRGKRAKGELRAVPAPLPPNEALSMLQSAIGYCQRAGLHVRYSNGGNCITLAIEGAQVATKDGAARFVVLPPAAKTTEASQ